MPILIRHHPEEIHRGGCHIWPRPEHSVGKWRSARGEGRGSAYLQDLQVREALSRCHPATQAVDSAALYRRMPPSSERYGRSCLTCRRRKVRCDSTRPRCNKCVKINEDCVYSATDPSTTRIRNALADSQNRLRALEQELSRIARLVPGECSAELGRVVRGFDSSVHLETRHHSSPHAHQPGVNAPSRSPTLQPRTDPVSETLTAESVGEEEYDATSKFYSPSQSHTTPSNSFNGSEGQIAYHKRWLVSNARFQDAHEELAYARIDKDNRLDPSIARKLMEIYWTWQAPLHNCIYRRCFFRDMALNGPYYSDFLLTVIYCHAARHITPDDPFFAALEGGEILLEQARLLLLDELKRDKPIVPTIQGLLILGGRQCGVGKASEGWLYTGMAIRMIQDRGLHLPGRKPLDNIEPDEYEIHKRLYLSAYAWDKSISLSLGRPPSLVSIPYSDHSLYDRTDDSHVWAPVHLGNLVETYPRTKSHNSTTFSYLIKLCTIVNEAFRTVLGPHARYAKFATFQALERTLEEFLESLPPALRMDERSVGTTCPPPHICCLNILHHTLLILIYRPFLLNAGAYQDRTSGIFEHAAQVCSREAAIVNNFFKAYGTCFIHRKQTYLLSYCVYTAATIDVHLAGCPDMAVSKAAKARLGTSLQMLDGEAMQSPGIQRSIDIIKPRLESFAVDGLHPINGVTSPITASSSNQGQGLWNAMATNRSHGQQHGDQDLPTALYNPGINTWPSGEASAVFESSWSVDDDQMFSAWDATNVNVGGGFVPETPWCDPFQ